MPAAIKNIDTATLEITGIEASSTSHLGDRDSFINRIVGPVHSAHCISEVDRGIPARDGSIFCHEDENGFGGWFEVKTIREVEDGPGGRRGSFFAFWRRDCHHQALGYTAAIVES